MRKEQSTNAINEKFLFQTCELNSALNVISGRWKAQIIYSISQGNNRFNPIRKELPNLSEQVLSRQLKELETHAILVRKVIPDTVPSGMEYILTSKGSDLIPILSSLCDWGKTYEEGKEIYHI